MPICLPLHLKWLISENDQKENKITELTSANSIAVGNFVTRELLCTRRLQDRISYTVSWVLTELQEDLFLYVWVSCSQWTVTEGVTSIGSEAGASFSSGDTIKLRWDISNRISYAKQTKFLMMRNKERRRKTRLWLFDKIVDLRRRISHIKASAFRRINVENVIDICTKL